MPRYVDGFVIPLPKNKVKDYQRISKKAGKIWMEHGALEYMECKGDDLKVKMGLPFPKLTKIKTNETVIFAFIVYKSRKHRDTVLKKVMNDKRLKMDMKDMPFDMDRMSYGGFEAIVDYLKS